MKRNLVMLRCPFCGCKPKLIEHDNFGGTMYGDMCECGATSGGFFYTKEEAILYWNRRAKRKYTRVKDGKPVETN